MGRLMAVLLGVLFLVPALSGGAEEKEKVFRATVDSDGVQRVEMVGGSYFFTPNHLIVRVGVPVELKVRKESGFVPHNIVVKAPEAGIDFDESLDTEAKTIRFTPKKTGTYPLYCSKRFLFFESHREKGMEGVIEVVP